MPLPQTMRNSASDNQEPSTERLFRVAAGLDSWTKDELAIKDSLPWWTIRMAITQSTLLQLAQSDAESNARLSKIVHELKTFREPEVFDAAADYIEVFLPENQRQDFRKLLKALPPPHIQSAPAPALKTDRRQGALAVTVAAVAVAALILFLSPFTQDSRFRNTAVVATVTFENRGTTRSTTQDIYSDDRGVYQADITTKLAQAWLIRMNDNDENINIHSAKNESGHMHFKMKLLPESRQCVEYFIVIAAEGEAISELDARRQWLYELSTELQTLNAQNDPTKALAEATIRRHLVNSGYTARVKIILDRYQRHRRPR